MKTIEEAKKYLRENFEEGAECPCCGQFVKSYKRSISGAMAYGLLLVYKEQGESDSWVDTTTLFQQRMFADFAKLRFWKLIEKLDGERADGSRRIGLWRLTEEGKLFVKEQIRVPKYAVVYNNKWLDYEGEPVSIRNCLGKKFDYAEIMQREL